MRKIVLNLLFLFTILNGEMLDSDSDGVIDKNDKCPNTPILTIVDKNGCAINNKIKLNYDFSVGYEYDKFDSNSYNKMVLTNFNIFYKKFLLSYFYSKFYNSDNHHSSDSILSLFYKKYYNKTLLTVGSGIYFKTWNNKKRDYFLKYKLTYFYKDLSFSFYQKYKIYGENYFNNINIFSLSVAYSKNSYYISPYFYTKNSLYNKQRWFKFYGVYLQKDLNKNIYLSLDISTQQSEKNNYSLITYLGFYF